MNLCTYPNPANASHFFPAFEHIDEAFFFFNPHFGVEYLNHQAKLLAKKMYGKIPRAGDNILGFISAGRRQAFQNVFEQALDDKQIQYEVQVEKTNIWLSCKYFSCKDETGEITGVYGLLRDISTEKALDKLEEKAGLIEQDLFHSRLLFEQFMQNSPLVAWLTDEKGNMQYMNPVCLSIYGLTEKDFGRSMFDLFNWTDALQWQIGNRKILNSGRPSESIEKAVKANGEQQVLKIYKFPLTVNGETMVGGWAADISDQVELQQKLLKSVERYEYVNEATSDAIYDWNVATGRVYRGTGYETVFGFRQKEVGIKTRLSLIHPDDYGLFKQKVFAALRNPHAHKYEIRYRFRHADGSYRHVADKAFIIRSGNTVTRVIGAMQDITAQVELQERLVNQEKESKQQLIKSIIETQEKERRQLSVELHDNVNQMLASCKLMLEVALENTADARMLTEKTYQSIQTVIDELRKISHELNPSAITDVGLVEGIEQLIEKINISGKINIRFIPDKQEYHHYLNEEDKIAIFRIVQEQLNNILKHSRAKNVLITLDVSDEHIKMCIKDDGIGFDPDKCKKGLGLRNIYHRVEYYGGTINITTGAGKGVEMCIALRASDGLCSGRHLKIA